MDRPSAEEGGTLEFNADARSAAYVFRAGSSLPEDPVAQFHASVCIVVFKGQLFAIELPDLSTAFGENTALDRKAAGTTLDLRRSFKVLWAKTTAAVPELVQAIGSYNVVYYDSRYYGVPQALSPALGALIQKRLRKNDSTVTSPNRPTAVRLLRRAARIVRDGLRRLLGRQRTPPASPIPWGDIDLDDLPGVISGATYAEVSAEVAKISGMAGIKPDSAKNKPATSFPVPSRQEDAPTRRIVGRLCYCGVRGLVLRHSARPGRY